MPRLVTFAELLSFRAEIEESSVLKTASASLLEKNTFLSHSHKDKDLLASVIYVLKGHGAQVYVDLNDPGLPDQVSRETAERLRKAIHGCKKFVLLVTTKSSDSRWIPWELGLGDGINSERNVALFPSAETVTENEWTEREYLGLYKRIVWGPFKGQQKGEWMVYNHINDTAEPLRQWIES